MGGDQQKAQPGAPTMGRVESMQHGGEAGMAVPADAQPAFRRRQRAALRRDDALLDLLDDCARLANPTVNHEPARTLRHEAPQEEDDEPEYGTGAEGGAPAPIRRQDRGIEQDQCTGRAEGGADPEAAIDDEIGAAAIARRDEFLDRR